MPCWHVGPCGVGCDGYAVNPPPGQPIPMYPPVQPEDPRAVEFIGWMQKQIDALKAEKDAALLQLSEVTTQRDNIEKLYLQTPSQQTVDGLHFDLNSTRKHLEETLRLNGELLKRVEEFKCSAKAEECTARHFGYNLAIDDVLEILREPLKR